jgi:hypothetical protein
MPLFSSPIRNRIVDLAAVTEDSPIRPREQPVIVFSPGMYIAATARIIILVRGPFFASIYHASGPTASGKIALSHVLLTPPFLSRRYSYSEEKELQGF